jgi:flap endonuclease-1
MEKIIEHLQSSGKHSIPPDWPWEEARRLFLEAEVSETDDIQFTWDKPDETGLVEFLCKQKGFNEDRVKNGCAKLVKSKGKSAQGRMDSFFTKLPANPVPKKKVICLLSGYN